MSVALATSSSLVDVTFRWLHGRRAVARKLAGRLPSSGKRKRERGFGRGMGRPPSLKQGYFRIITGTLLGGILGFYVMHRVENSYKEKMKQRLARYEREKMRREKQQQLEHETPA